MNPRTDAIRQIAQSHPDHQPPAADIDAIFGCDVFSLDILQKRLPKPVFRTLKATIARGERLDPDIADTVACAMKDWAISKGATHYTHWFQPMTGLTAEKHDAFLSPTGEGRVINEFSGKMLICGEPDASSFPSGGLRSTFEARGYTAWDPTVPAFIIGRTLHVPTLFYSYSGEALDRKIPLMRSISALSRQAMRILRLFGNTTATFVRPSVGPEQEYFLVDRRLAALRPDLLLAGRTLMGTPPAKGQEMEDHYFGSIPARVMAFMQDVEDALFRLGIPAKTRHNEVAPGQFEIAPIYEDANIATDHNMLIMNLLHEIAPRHDFICLLHEKPFAGVNGSGKHNNWSISDSEGNNLLDPGKTPLDNAQFLVFLAAVLRAVHKHSAALRLGTVGAGNDHRLGANEAPPAIISVFLGSELQSIIDAIVGESDYTETERKTLRIGVDVLPSIPQDTTDRNRTSPVAFTGNKFEFRMPGSSQSIAGPVTVLNTIMAEELSRFYAVLKEAPDFNKALHDLVRKAFIEHGRIIFNGNGYEEAWVEEAARRGLANLRSTADALPTYVLPKNVELMMKHGVYTKEEMFSRHEIHMEKYRKVIHIEAATMVDMVQHEILNAASEYESKLCETMLRKHEAAPELPCHVEKSLANSIGILNDKLLEQTVTLKTALETAPVGASGEEEMRYYHDVVAADMDAVRDTVDRLETLTAGKYWPYPTFYDLLFSV